MWGVASARTVDVAESFKEEVVGKVGFSRGTVIIEHMSFQIVLKAL